MFWGGGALIGAALLARVVTGEQSLVLGGVFVGGLLAASASVIPFVLGSLPRIVQARTSDDGTFVIVENPHPAFITATSGQALSTTTE